MIATLVFDEETQTKLGLSRVRDYPLPLQTCIVLGHVCDREGRKESKSKGNYTPPEIILDRVRMDFAVLDEVAGYRAAPGEVAIAREDLEGMDLADGSEVSVYRPGREAAALRAETVGEQEAAAPRGRGLGGRSGDARCRTFAARAFKPRCPRCRGCLTTSE